MDWDHKDEWRKKGENFTIVISRHYGEKSRNEGPHRWAVYAYIYPAHPHFKNFEGPLLSQKAATCLPLHGGASLVRYHYAGDVLPTSVQVGADYHHDGDEHYTHYESAEDAANVFHDAEKLHAWLSEK